MKRYKKHKEKSKKKIRKNIKRIKITKKKIIVNTAYKLGVMLMKQISISWVHAQFMIIQQNIKYSSYFLFTTVI